MDAYEFTGRDGCTYRVARTLREAHAGVYLYRLEEGRSVLIEECAVTGPEILRLAEDLEDAKDSIEEDCVQESVDAANLAGAAARITALEAENGLLREERDAGLSDLERIGGLYTDREAALRENLAAALADLARRLKRREERALGQERGRILEQLEALLDDTSSDIYELVEDGAPCEISAPALRVAVRRICRAG